MKENDLTCKCGASVPDDKIYFCEGVNPDGDEVSQVGVHCDNCGENYYLIGFVCVDTKEEAKEWLNEDQNWQS